MLPGSILCYAVISKNQMEAILEHAAADPTLVVHAMSDRMTFVLDHQEPLIHISVGADEPNDYYWVQFPIPGKGHAMLEHILSVDTAQTAP